MPASPEDDIHDSSPEQQEAVDFRLGYRRWLDGIRGLAILMVLAFHLGLLPGGSLGVDVFFVLSGFLITALLVEEWQRRGSISLKAFYLRRGMRLLPAFGVLLLILALSSLWIESRDEARTRRQEVIVAGCYVANWPTIHQIPMPTLGHTWSLSVEEQFYLLWPILLTIMLRLKFSRRQICLFVGAGILASATHRIVLYALHRTPETEKAAYVIRLYMGSDTRADALLVGCLVGLLAAWNLLSRSRRFVYWTGVGSLVSVASLSYLSVYRCLDHSQYYHGLFTLVALMVAVIIVRLLSKSSRLSSLLLESSPLVWTGRLSYGLYLFHIPVMYGVRQAGVRQQPAAFLLSVALTIAAALVSYFCIERPCLRLKDRLRQPSPITAGNPMAPVEWIGPNQNPRHAAA